MWAGPDSAAVLYLRLCQLFLVPDPCAAGAGGTVSSYPVECHMPHQHLHGGLLYGVLYLVYSIPVHVTALCAVMAQASGSGRDARGVRATCRQSY